MQGKVLHKVFDPKGKMYAYIHTKGGDGRFGLQWQDLDSQEGCDASWKHMHVCTRASVMLSHDGRRQRDRHGNNPRSGVVGKQLWQV